MRHEFFGIPAAGRYAGPRASAVLAVRPDLHRRELRTEGGRAAVRRRTWRGDRRTRYQSRGEDVPDDPDGEYDFGLGAGFYVNATRAPWSRHYRMYDYVVDELPALVTSKLPLDGNRAGIFGHSMGGHGALTIALKNPTRYRSVSAFSPIVSPLNCPWGHKALGNYLGDDRETWRTWDTTELVRGAERHLPVLVDQGEADNFLDEQLKTDLLEQASAEADYPMTIRRQPGYDHSYFFIATFIADHIEFHSRNF